MFFPIGLRQRRAKATADPSTSLRSAQDDNAVVVRSFGAESMETNRSFLTPSLRLCSTAINVMHLCGSNPTLFPAMPAVAATPAIRITRPN
jgi:hypothetical protein